MKYFLIFLFSFSFNLNGQKKFSNLDVFNLQYAQDPQISYAGNKIVYVRTMMDIMKDGKRNSLWIINPDGSDHKKLTSNESNERSPRWSPDGKRIAFISSSDNNEGTEIYIYWTDTKQYSKISQLEKSPGSLQWSPDGKYIAFSMFVPQDPIHLVTPPSKPKGANWAPRPRITERLKHEADGSGYMERGFRHIFIISSEGGAPIQITSENYNHRSFKWTSDSKNFIFSSNYNKDWEYDFRNSELYSISIDNKKVVALTNRFGPDYGVSISPDGKKMAYLGYDDKVQTYQISKLYVMNVDGSNKTEIKTNLDRDISNLNWSEDNSGLYFTYDDNGNTKIGYINLKGNTKKLCDNLGGTTIGRPYGGGSYSVSSNGKIAYTITSPYHPSDVAYFDGKTVKKVTNLNKDLLGNRDLGTVEEIWYMSSVDGRKIQGWIAKPPNFNKNIKYPLIVENHGGPISNYGDRFSPEILLYSSGGYVVFYPNPRGSTSYGEEFGNLLYRNYPGDDYHDVMDGVDEMIKTGYIDENNLFVTGGSAGGIMTAWIIGKNDRFQAAVVAKPVMNWISKTLTADNYY